MSTDETAASKANGKIFTLVKSAVALAAIDETISFHLTCIAAAHDSSYYRAEALAEISPVEETLASIKASTVAALQWNGRQIELFQLAKDRQDLEIDMNLPVTPLGPILSQY